MPTNFLILGKVREVPLLVPCWLLLCRLRAHYKASLGNWRYVSIFVPTVTISTNIVRRNFIGSQIRLALKMLGAADPKFEAYKQEILSMSILDDSRWFRLPKNVTNSTIERLTIFHNLKVDSNHPNLVHIREKKVRRILIMDLRAYSDFFRIWSRLAS